MKLGKMPGTSKYFDSYTHIWLVHLMYFLGLIIYNAFVFRKFLWLSFVANVWRFLHQKKRNFNSFPTMPTLFRLSGFIQLLFSFFWCHSNVDLSRIHEKCANSVFLHNKVCQKFCQTAAWPPFLWKEFLKCDIIKWSEEV